MSVQAWLELIFQLKLLSLYAVVCSDVEEASIVCETYQDMAFVKSHFLYISSLLPRASNDVMDCRV